MFLQCAVTKSMPVEEVRDLDALIFVQFVSSKHHPPFAMSALSRLPSSEEEEDKANIRKELSILTGRWEKASAGQL